jgi:hypothetical protein
MAYLSSINSAGGSAKVRCTETAEVVPYKKFVQPNVLYAVCAFMESQKPGFVMTNPNIPICIF